jgi:outer membrane receptor protein involved in Fe transport
MQASIFSQEINLASVGNGPWRWTAGAIYRDGDTKTLQSLPDFGIVIDWTTESKSYAVFGEVTRLFWDGRFEATLGARYFNDDVTVTEDQATAPFIPPNYYHETESFDTTTPRVVLTWHPEDWIRVYASYSEGFRSGAPQAYYARSAAIPQAGAPVQPDELQNYELGLKGELFQDRLLFDAALYFVEWEGVHQGISKEINGVCCVGQLVNGPPASGAGFDLGMSTRPVKGLELGMTFSWNDLTFDEDVLDDQGVLQFHKGSRLSFSPERTVGGFVDWAFPLGSGGLQGRTGASVNYTSKQQWGGTNLASSDSSVVTNAKFAIEARSWVATLFGDNLSNEQGRIYTNPSDLNPINPASASRMRPRTIGLQLEYRF